MQPYRHPIPPKMKELQTHFRSVDASEVRRRQVVSMSIKKLETKVFLPGKLWYNNSAGYRGRLAMPFQKGGGAL